MPDVVIVNNNVSATITASSGPPVTALIVSGPPVVISVAVVGRPGIDGGAIRVVAAETLGGHRVITADGYHCLPSNSYAAFGISTGAAEMGTSTTIITTGPMTESSWSWTPSLPIYIGANGTLTQTPPPTGIVRRIAWAITSTLINVDFHTPITQSGG